MMSLRATLATIAVDLLDVGRPRRRRALPAGRIESCLPASARLRSGWRLWMRRRFGVGRDSTGNPGHLEEYASDRSLATLLAVRREFADSLRDIRTAPVFDLLERIHAARSLRELWHLRPEVFGIVARFHTQAEAERRIGLLNRHFPTRSPRSGFGAL